MATRKKKKVAPRKRKKKAAPKKKKKRPVKKRAVAKCIFCSAKDQSTEKALYHSFASIYSQGLRISALELSRPEPVAMGFLMSSGEHLYDSSLNEAVAIVRFDRRRHAT